MGAIVDGRFVSDSVEAVLDTMVADLEAQIGDDVPDDISSIARTLYLPWAERIVELQNDLGLVLDSAQIDNATAEALDFLTALIGVPRRQSVRATGVVTFSRSNAATQDYQVRKGVRLQTSGSNPIVYRTTEKVTLTSGNSSVDAKIEAEVGGVDGNVGAGKITVFVDDVSGVEEATNAAATDGGRDRESDEELRERAKENLTTGSRASASGLISALRAIPAVKSVSIFLNDQNDPNGDGQPAHSFELVVETEDGTDLDDRIAQAIMDTKAAGDTSSSGVYGTAASGVATLINGQTFTIGFSEPVSVQIYVDLDLQVTEEYAGDDAVRDNVVQYIGGVLSSGNNDDGRLSVGDDVIFGSVEYAIRDTPGVYDVTSLTINGDAVPTGTDTSNIPVSLGEKATADATDGSIAITTTVVTP
ncbi:baseplate J/gp47 family protein [Halobellus limi]|uniref:Baseplate J family protein n=1 Tax=Halobellus limi TaxID=699433 RepID=A0A1H5ZLM5_9EURY|nr:baseplate J/gp47 family protein [Halobellus limi]QCC48077.1 baseplate J family protein [Halobellus limi]SEG36246.1 Baseplate J-like protein [Halobellus limi]